ncbi:MAG: hypothetical protein ACWGN7_04470 [Thermodesulfovibrionales bacterium]
MTEKEELIHLREEVEHLRREVARLTPSLKVLLKTRGFSVHRQSMRERPLLPPDPFLDEYYSLMRSYAFRLFLRDVIKHREGFSLENVARFASDRIAQSYIRKLLAMDVIVRAEGGYALRQRPVRSFGPTLEWFVAELLRREYHTEAIWSVSFKRPRVGGDYDVIAKLAWRLIYIEVKSSPPKQIYQSEISEFWTRVSDLSPEIAIFFMDTELRMKDKIVPMFEAEMSSRGLRPEVSRMRKELFHIDHRIFIMNAKDSIESNFSTILRWYFLYNRSDGCDR